MCDGRLPFRRNIEKSDIVVFHVDFLGFALIEHRKVLVHSASSSSPFANQNFFVPLMEWLSLTATAATRVLMFSCDAPLEHGNFFHL